MHIQMPRIKIGTEDWTSVDAVKVNTIQLIVDRYDENHDGVVFSESIVGIVEIKTADMQEFLCNISFQVRRDIELTETSGEVSS